ncbi:TonB-dependent receptor [Tritonibacter scottomollicae]|uniref:TonB-dependent receptor n=1 Tax=Tritonibacter scottomollicae TaxID=483013 RepID=UPI003AA9A5D2
MGQKKWLGGAALIAFTAAAYPAYAAENTLADDAAQEQSSDQQDAQEGGLNVIVVTAQRRQESVQDIPISISAFDSEELERRGVTNALEVAQFVPNLVGINNTGLGSANAYYLRGLGNTETIPTFDPPIGTYVDDIYLSRQNANNLSFFDVERIEVLRGPQGTLFGRNTTGGAVSVFLAEPDFEFGGSAEAGYGSYGLYTGRASIDIPLADSFAVKVSGYYQNDKGYAFNTTTGERANENDGWGVRLGLRGELSENARWTGSYIHTLSEGANILNFDCDPANTVNCDGRFVTTGHRSNSNFGGRFTGKKDDFGYGNKTSMDFLSSNLELGGDNFTVNFITGYVYTTQDYALDFADGRGLPSISNPVPPVLGYTLGGFTIANEGEFSQFSQEVKFNASLGDGLVDLVGGVYYFEEDNFSDFGDLFTISLPFAPPPDGFPLILADRTLRNSTKAYAGFLQGDINVTDQIKLTAGIRYTDETKRFSIRDNRASCNDGTLEATCLSDPNLVAANGTVIPRKQQIKIWTPRFAINYQANNDLLIYASATRGFKSGGWNARGTSAGELLPFDAEKAWSYEAGIKSELLDRRLRVNLSAYLLDVSDLQTPSAFTRANGSIAFITRNFADYENKGIELEINAVPVEGLNIFVAGGYQDDKYKLDANSPMFDEFGIQSVVSQIAVCQAQLAAGLVPGGGGAEASSCGVGIVAEDGNVATPVRSPKFNVAMGASYNAELGNGLSLTPAINANWRDKSEVGTSNFSIFSGPVTSSTGATFPANPFSGNYISGSFSDSRWIVNGTLTLRSDAGWSLTAECRNCFDEESIESSLANYSYLNPPRTWLVKGRFEF